MSHGGATTPIDLTGLQEQLGTSIDPTVLVRAVTHRSYAYENGGLPHNERLEFLGDAVLGLVVTEELYRRHPDAPEGQLARLRAAVVNARSLATVARTIGLGDFLLLGVGEERTRGREKSSILADTLEAVLGAVYIDAGMVEATRVVHSLVDPLIAHAEALGAGLDWKTSLQELAARTGLGVPQYRIGESGPDHAKSFTAEVIFAGAVRGYGEGPSKKVAEGAAAQAAWEAIDGEVSRGSGLAEQV